VDFRIIEKFSLLDFGALADVYQESILQDGERNYPNLSYAEQQLEARQDLYNYLREVFFQTTGAICVVLEEKGIMYCSGRVEPYRDGMLISALETAPDYRRRGFAKILLSQIVEHIQEKNLPLYSHIYKNNNASRRLHLACGFTVFENYATFLDGTVSHQAQTYCYKK